MTLYTYCLRYDDGAAPNPFHGFCTLTICKPAIRRVARKGDWVVGLGGKDSPIGDISGRVIYAMKITKKMSLKEYDEYCRKSLKAKIPGWRSKDIVKRVGDCIYDYSQPGEPRLRPGVHDEFNRETDLGGENALISDHFFYFGDDAVPLPAHLKPIVHQTQGHKSHANSRHAEQFVAWIEGLGFESNTVHSKPAMWEQMQEVDCRAKCSKRDLAESKKDRIC